MGSEMCIRDRSKIVGAMSASIPFDIFLFFSSTKIIGTGLVVWAVFGEPSLFNIFSCLKKLLLVC